MIEPLDSNGEQTKGHVHFGESEKGLAQMRLHHELIGNTGDLVHETGQGQSIFVMIGAGGRELLLKGLDRTDDRSMRVVNWTARTRTGISCPRLWWRKPVASVGRAVLMARARGPSSLHDSQFGCWQCRIVSPTQEWPTTSWRRCPVMRSAPSLHSRIRLSMSITHRPVGRLSRMLR